MEDLLSEIMQVEFHKLSGEAWNPVFDKLMILLGADDPEIVGMALERTASAIWSERHMPGTDQQTKFRRSTDRLAAVSPYLVRERT